MVFPGSSQIQDQGVILLVNKSFNSLQFAFDITLKGGQYKCKNLDPVEDTYPEKSNSFLELCFKARSSAHHWAADFEILFMSNNSYNTSYYFGGNDQGAQYGTYQIAKWSSLSYQRYIEETIYFTSAVLPINVQFNQLCVMNACGTNGIYCPDYSNFTGNLIVRNFTTTTPLDINSVNYSCVPSSVPIVTQPTLAPTSKPTTATPTSRPSKLPTIRPSRKPTTEPTAKPSMIPTQEPSFKPTKFPSALPSSFQTILPTIIPSEYPTYGPSNAPSIAPSFENTEQPTSETLRSPTSQGYASIFPSFSSNNNLSPGSSSPSFTQTVEPSNFPTMYPSEIPTTQSPTAEITINPTVLPSLEPSNNPTSELTIATSILSTERPTTFPTMATSTPTTLPSVQPSSVPSSAGSNLPSSSPTYYQTNYPSSYNTYSPSAIITQNPSSEVSRPSSLSSYFPSMVPSSLSTFLPSAFPSQLSSNKPVSSVQPTYMSSNSPSCQPTTSNPTAISSANPSSQTTTNIPFSISDSSANCSAIKISNIGSQYICPNYFVWGGMAVSSIATNIGVTVSNAFFNLTVRCPSNRIERHIISMNDTKFQLNSRDFHPSNDFTSAASYQAMSIASSKLCKGSCGLITAVTFQSNIMRDQKSNIQMKIHFYSSKYAQDLQHFKGSPCQKTSSRRLIRLRGAEDNNDDNDNSEGSSDASSGSSDAANPCDNGVQWSKNITVTSTCSTISKINATSYPSIQPTNQPSTIPTMLPSVNGNGKSYGPLSIVAGRANYAGNVGCGGKSIASLFNSPVDVLPDSSGGFYVSDQSNNVVRYVTASGILQEYAGGGNVVGNWNMNSKLVQLRSPQCLAVDASGNIYIAEYATHVVRVVTKTTGIISVFAGTYGKFGFFGDNGYATNALLAYPVGLTSDGSSLYISTYGDGRVRKINLATNIISTFNDKLYQPMGIAYDRQSNSIVVADSGNHRVVRCFVNYQWTLIAGVTSISGFAGDGGIATSAKLYFPSDVAVDSNGNIFIADSFNNLIRFVDNSTSYISTIAGVVSTSYSRYNFGGITGFNGDGLSLLSSQLSYPRGISWFGNNLFIVDTNNRIVRKTSITSSTTISSSSDIKVQSIYQNGEYEVVLQNSFQLILLLILITYIYACIKSRDIKSKEIIQIFPAVIDFGLISIYLFQIRYASSLMYYLVLGVYIGAMLPFGYYLFHQNQLCPSGVASILKNLISGSPNESSRTITGTAKSLLTNLGYCIYQMLIVWPLQCIWFMIGVVLYQSSIWSIEIIFTSWIHYWSDENPLISNNVILLARRCFQSSIRRQSVDYQRLLSSIIWNTYCRTMPLLVILTINIFYDLRSFQQGEYVIDNRYMIISRNMMIVSLCYMISIISIINTMSLIYGLNTELKTTKNRKISKNDTFKGFVRTRNSKKSLMLSDSLSSSSRSITTIASEDISVSDLDGMADSNLPSDATMIKYTDNPIYISQTCFDYLQSIRNTNPEICRILDLNRIGDAKSLLVKLNKEFADEIISIVKVLDIESGALLEGRFNLVMNCGIHDIESDKREFIIIDDIEDNLHELDNQLVSVEYDSNADDKITFNLWDIYTA